MTSSENRLYCPSLTTYQRRRTRVVNIGDVPVGATTRSGCRA